MTKRAAIYVRVSSEGQAHGKGDKGKGDKLPEKDEPKTSPDAQEKDCRAWCQAHVYTVTGVYRDVAKYRAGGRIVEPSGTRADRPQLRRMLADADAGAFDVLIAWREDRLYRAFRPMLDVLDCIERNGLTVELTNDSFDARFAPIKAWAAKLELEAKHERTTMGMIGRLEKGKPGNHPPMYGYRLAGDHGDHYEPDPLEAPWVTQMWRWYAEGQTVNEIRRRLIVEGAPQRSAAKHHWHPAVIQKYIHAASYYLGVTHVEIGGQRFEVPTPILVDAETAARVNARRQSYKIYPAGNQKALALAAGKVYCQACGTRLRVSTTKYRGKPYSYYTCQNYSRGVHGAGCSGNMPLASLDTQIWAKVWKALTEKKGEFANALEARIAELQAQEVDAEKECARLQGQLDGLLMERQKVITQWRKGKMTDTDYDLQLGALTIEQAGAERELGIKSLLVGGQADKLIAIANRYRADTARGMAGLNDDPKTPAHALKQFETRRKYVDGLVVRVDVQTDKTPLVSLEIDLSEMLRIRQPIAAYRRR